MGVLLFWGLALAVAGGLSGPAIHGGRSWGYLKGSSGGGSPGSYGHYGSFDPSSVPRAQSKAAFAAAADGLWLFEADATTADVWVWNGRDWKWTHRSPETPYGVYSGPSVHPGKRSGATMWGRRGGGFLVFGGRGCGATSCDGARPLRRKKTPRKP